MKITQEPQNVEIRTRFLQLSYFIDNLHEEKLLRGPILFSRSLGERCPISAFYLRYDGFANYYSVAIGESAMVGWEHTSRLIMEREWNTRGTQDRVWNRV